MRILFFGTPEFAVPVLHDLVGAGHEIVAAVTQPDRPAGRGGRLAAPAVKRAADRLGIRVLQPERLRAKEIHEEIRALAPDAIVVAAFGQILPVAVLEIPPLGCLNVHASLLPEFRGASPISAAILAGKPETGVTIMLMEQGLDSGPILAQRRTTIRPDDTTASLSRRLSEVGGTLLVETLPRWSGGEIAPRAQDDRAASYAPTLKREQGQIDWTQPAELIERQCRAYYPWPGCFTRLERRLIKLLAVRVVVGSEQQGVPPGTLVSAKGELLVATGQGRLEIDLLQPEGKRAMSAREFSSGHQEVEGRKFD